jgi:hypothetical protein
LAGPDRAPDASAAPHSEPSVEEIPSGGTAARETEVLDLTGDASDEEDVAAMLEAVIEGEVVEETDPERSVAPPDEAVPGETDLEWSGASLSEAAPDTGVRDAPLEEEPYETATASAVPTTMVGEETPDAAAPASVAVDAPAPPLATAQDRAEAVTPVFGGSEPPAVLLSEQHAAEDTDREVAPEGESQALEESGRAAAPAASDALTVARRTAPASAKGKEPAPPKTNPEASSGSSSDQGIEMATSGSGDELMWRHRRSRQILFHLDLRREKKEQEEVDRAVKLLTEAFIALGNSHRVRFRVTLYFALRS